MSAARSATCSRTASRRRPSSRPSAVGVVVNEIIAVLFLKEPLRYRDLLGLVLVISGIVMVIFAVPESDEKLSVHHLLSREIYFHPRAYWYLIALTLCIIFFICYLEPRYAQERILVWLLLCSAISSMTVAACRGFSSLVTLIPTECFAGTPSCHHGVLHPPCVQTVGHGLFWVLLVAIIVTAVWSAMYLQKAMMVFGNTEVRGSAAYTAPRFTFSYTCTKTLPFSHTSFFVCVLSPSFALRSCPFITAPLQ